MSISDWGEWLPRQIEQTTPNGVSIWFLGGNGFVLKGVEGTTLFIDPFFAKRDANPEDEYPRVRMIPVPMDPADVTEADGILITHEHGDHVHGPSQAPILERTEAQLYGPDDSIAVARERESWTDEWDIFEDQLVEVSEGDSFDVGEFTVHVEAANDPDATHPVSYVIEHESATVFHAGDSRRCEAFPRIGAEYDIDLGILAYGSWSLLPDGETGEPTPTKWYNDENELVVGAYDLRLDRVLPSHWDIWKGLTADPVVIHHHMMSFPYPQRLEIAEIGDRIDL